MPDEKDPDANKGAVEQDQPGQPTNTSLQGQLPHRNENPLVKSRDTDFPEPGENEEHSGEPEEDGLTSGYRKPAKAPHQAASGSSFDRFWFSLWRSPGSISFSSLESSLGWRAFTPDSLIPESSVFCGWGGCSALSVESLSRLVEPLSVLLSRATSRRSSCLGESFCFVFIG